MTKQVFFENLGHIEYCAKHRLLCEASIELTDKCNWRCKHCYMPGNTNEGLTFSEVSNILAQLRDAGVFGILFTGGEIFCRKDSLKIIKLARKMGFNVSLFTNLSLLTEEIILELSNIYITNISFSIFSLDPYIHDSISQVNGSLKKVLRNIELLLKTNINLEIKTVLMEDNYDSYIDLQNFCKEKNITYRATTNIFPKFDGDTSNLNMCVSDEKLKSIILDIDSIVGVEYKENKSEDYLCNSIRYSLAIDSRGDIFPCLNFRKKIGNFIDGIMNLWTSSNELSILQKQKFKDTIHCINCSLSKYCVHCAGISFLETGNCLERSLMDCRRSRARYLSFNKNENMD